MTASARGGVREHGVLFSDEMVRALLDGSKRQTRRPVPGVPDGAAVRGTTFRNFRTGRAHPCAEVTAPRPALLTSRICEGDRIWVRECWALRGNEDHHPVDAAGNLCRAEDAVRLYRASGDDIGDDRWTPSIHMPRWASRLVFDVTCVRVERVQDISEEDAMAEGVVAMPPGFAGSDGLEGHRAAFRDLWDGIYAPRGLGWDANPWVWVYDLRRVDKVAPVGAREVGRG